MSTRYKGSVMAATAAVNSSTTAIGIWRTNEVMQAIQAALWPLFNVAPTSVEYLIVAGGGGGGGRHAGGGGAGGYRTATGFSVAAGTSYTLTIGAGGTGYTNNDAGGTGNGTSGNNSVFRMF